MTQIQPGHGTDREPLVLTAAQAKPLLADMGINQIYAAIARGDIPSIKIGRRILIPRQRLLDMLNGGGSPDAA